jgi:uncharacterized protein YebE (UPF0316 family)
MAALFAWLNENPWFWPMFIIPARIMDVSIGTIRTIAVVRGNRGLATALGFFEVLIWATAVSGVLADVTPIKLLSYAAGFAMGNLTGILIEKRIALGSQLVMLVSTQRTQSVAFALRMANYMVTEVPAKGARGDVALCFTVVPRRQVEPVLQIAHKVDPGVHAVLEDVRFTELMQPRGGGAFTGWRAIMRKK